MIALFHMLVILFVHCVVSQLSVVTIRNDNVGMSLRVPDIIPYCY